MRGFVMLQEAGFQIICETPDTAEFTPMQIRDLYSGRFTESEGLYLRLQRGFAERTGDQLF